jgi:hypothetical protein
MNKFKDRKSKIPKYLKTNRFWSLERRENFGYFWGYLCPPRCLADCLCNLSLINVIDFIQISE